MCRGVGYSTTRAAWSILPGMLTPTRLKAVTGLSQASDLFRELGFGAAPVRIDASELGIGDFPDNLSIRTGGSRAKGYGILLAEMHARPRSMQGLGRRLIERFHDRPLGVVGISGGSGSWHRLIIVRPRSVKGVIGSVQVSKLEVDLGSPTRHDTEVLTALSWHGAGKEAQDRIDRALDAERVTKRFYLELAEHHRRLKEGLSFEASRDSAVLAGIKESVGPGDDPFDRVALRILTQVLFCWFLQRKRLLAGDAEYLRNRYTRHTGRYYQTELERLFYDGLAKPPGDRPSGAPGPEVPFLNGGLFVRTYGDVSLPLPDELFDLEEGLLGFLGRWTFTVAEDVPDETEVAVDPEMLGKVFENLISDDAAKKQGTVYTPRPVVHFMCREALVPWLQDRIGVSEEWARRLLVQDVALPEYAKAFGAEAALKVAEDLDHALHNLRALDPAVGSGAFLLGMLAEIVRLRRLALLAMSGREPASDELLAWKLRAIEHTLFAVDINPTAIELCRLRLWLSLVVDLPEGALPHPLPNLEYRTVVANSLTDFVNLTEVQNTREGQAGGLELPGLDASQLIGLRFAYFGATDPTAKQAIRLSIEAEEDKLIEQVFADAVQHGERSDEARAQLEELMGRFRSWDREFPLFAPGFHAPEVWLQEEGWDITIMNPPYLSQKEAAQHLDAMRRADYKRHFGELNDLMILFARRARQLTKPGGVVSMIFNDSIFTSTDAEDLRCELLEKSRVLVCARTKCFVGKAVNGGVVVTAMAPSDPPPALRWVEGYKRPTSDFASASDPLPFSGEPGAMVSAGSMEVFSTPGDLYRLLPHRPFYRPSAEAIGLLDRFTAMERWASIGTRSGWARLSNTNALRNEIHSLAQQGWYKRLGVGQWVLLGYVMEGGVGFQTGDDKRFVGAIQGTDAAVEHMANQDLLERALGDEPRLLTIYERLRGKGLDRERALLDLWDDMGNDALLTQRRGTKPALWPKGATFRVASKADVHTLALSDTERRRGIASGPFWVPFEKGDQSQAVEDEEGQITYLGARWLRENPLVIDWSEPSVRLLRQRASGPSSRRKPYFRNEDLWFTEGVTWNRVASYLRIRRVPGTAIFSDKTPLVRPTVEWLHLDSLLALLNADVIDFLLRTFLGSRMQVEIGDVRHVPIPVLSEAQNEQLLRLANQAIAEKLAAEEGEHSRLKEIEREVNRLVRDLYGVADDAKLWVVR
jgi:hypothetical protein